MIETPFGVYRTHTTMHSNPDIPGISSLLYSEYDILDPTSQHHTHHEYPPPRHQELRIFIPLIFDGVTFAIENQKDVRKSSQSVEGSRSNGASIRVVATKQSGCFIEEFICYVRSNRQ